MELWRKKYRIFFTQAHDKQFALERLWREKTAAPKKEEYRKELVNMLKGGYLEELDGDLVYQVIFWWYEISLS